MNHLRRPSSCGKKNTGKTIAMEDLGSGDAPAAADNEQVNFPTAAPSVSGVDIPAASNSGRRPDIPAPSLGGHIAATSLGGLTGAQASFPAATLHGLAGMQSNFPATPLAGAMSGYPGASLAGALSGYPGASVAGLAAPQSGFPRAALAGLASAHAGGYGAGLAGGQTGMPPGAGARSISRPEESVIPDWMNSAGTAALGPNWLSSDTSPEALRNRGQSSATATLQPQGGIRNQVPTPSRTTSTKRTARRTQRAPAAAPPVVDIDTDPSTAEWSDDNTRIVCEIFAEEVLAGNRDNTHLSKTGYKNVMKKFTERTGLVYKRKQFKNKWEKLRQDYGIWKQLANKETGIGWDEGRKNIIMPDKWWKQISQEIQGASRFKKGGLQNEERLQIIFEDLRNTGEDHWNASSGVAPTQTINLSERSPINDCEEDDADINDDSEPEEVTPTSVTGKRGRVLGNPKTKKPKTSTGQWFQEQMGRMVDMNERTTASCESIAKKENSKKGYSIEHVMGLVKACGAISGTNEHFTASLILTKTSEREMFMTSDTPEERFDWLRRKHEWMTRNDVPK